MGLPKLAIIGSSPVAAYAAAACAHWGVTPDVFGTPPVPGKNVGAFWLHAMPAEYPYRSELMKVKYAGTAEGYLRKQWGHYHPKWPTSFVTKEGFPVVEEFSTFYNDEMALPWLSGHGNWYPPTSRSWEALRESYDAVFVSGRDVPRTLLGEKHFNSLIIPNGLAIYTATLVPPFVADAWLPEPICIYDGTDEIPFVRTTIMGNRISCEIPFDKAYSSDIALEQELGTGWKPSLLDDIPPWVYPPYFTDDFPDGICPIGRWATMRREELSHRAYYTVSAYLRERFGEEQFNG